MSETWGWTHLIGQTPDQLIAMAQSRASDLDLTPSGNEQRNVINMLRHEYSNYDGQVRHTRTDHLYAELLDAIAEDFPWLARQCAADKTSHGSRVPLWVQNRRYSHKAAQAKQREARKAIAGLSVGDNVTVMWHGPRDAVIVEVRRTRVQAAFTLPNGTEHVIDRSADEVRAAAHHQPRRSPKAASQQANRDNQVDLG
jgi:hypothetical protein